MKGEHHKHCNYLCILTGALFMVNNSTSDSCQRLKHKNKTTAETIFYLSISQVSSHMCFTRHLHNKFNCTKCLTPNRWEIKTGKNIYHSSVNAELTWKYIIMYNDALALVVNQLKCLNLERHDN